MPKIPNHWQPSADLNAIKARTALYQKIRAFFVARNVLEVQTPILSQHTVTDVFIESFATDYINNNEKTAYYLQTSPEYHMKRLLAADSGPIFQITSAFRNHGEFGHEHNPEFTLLEWYRPGFNHHNLMTEISELLESCFDFKPAQKISYCDLFLQHFNLNPHTCSVHALKKLAKQNDIEINDNTLNKDDWLNLLLTHCIEPTLGIDRPIFIFDYPETQAALSRLRHGDITVAERFELYINGQEIGNGFHELTDRDQQQKRFEKDQAIRRNNKQAVPSIDQRFLNALDHGLPDCSGVAIGLDRLLMLNLVVDTIRKTLAFAWDVA